ncbi:DUF2798 domain-containing protein [Bacillus sp. AGMB 02131]|uniref:DUF2798 domain-containing protein n=1 Tax=Peribacillus faecalis TaxID=2772559 RepID=A0A927HD39_9BACI|nr:DUF2798 domain-containing protein [Peribacillus faecalis]MBD3110181.1 DUF2798 domain-containing protein [Peribacillus faecalis]
MPSNKREGIIFGLMMCFGMVFVMTFYNMAINGTLDKLTITGAIMSFVIGFAIAFVLDLFIVGPAAKKVAMKLVKNKENKALMIISISTCMVLGMASCMSLYGLITAYAHGALAGQSLISSYIMIFFKNFIMALPLQLLVMGPIVRFLFVKFVKQEQQPMTNSSALAK